MSNNRIPPAISPEIRAAAARQARWNRRYLSLAGLVATWSKHPDKTARRGAVLVRPDFTFASLGFAGLARGLAEDPHRYFASDPKLQSVLEAEENAFLFSREPVEGMTLYTSSPAITPHLAALAAQRRIARLVYAGSAELLPTATRSLLDATDIVLENRSEDYLTPGRWLAAEPLFQPRGETDSWDLCFMSLARLISSWSKDPNQGVGAVAVRADRTVASLGFNSLPQAIPDDPELLSDKAAKLGTILHAEDNAIALAREPLAGTTLYIWPYPPCWRCTGPIIQQGFARVVSPQVVKTSWARSYAASKADLRTAGIEVSELPIRYDAASGEASLL